MHKCLFNHNGTCDQYVITIGVDGSCQEYVETEDVIIRPVLCEHCGHYEDHGLLQNPCNKHECYRHRKENACVDFIAIRGQRAKANLFDDAKDATFTFTFEGQFNPKYLEQLKAEAECDCSEYDLINKKCRLPKCCWS